MAKISIVVPVYNVEIYLKKCIESLIGQTLEDIEIILVDDGSTDCSGNICEEYALVDERIKVLHKNNSGLSCARNAGICLASAPYIMFVDSDDWVEKSFCEFPYEMVKKHNADMVLFLYNKILKYNDIVQMTSPFQTGLMSKHDAMYFNTQISSAAWIGIYRKELFKDTRFPEGKYCEDIGTTYKLIEKANTIGFIDATLYNYRYNRPGSITTDQSTKNHPDRKEMCIAKVKDLYEGGYSECAQIEALRLIMNYGSKMQNHDVVFDIMRDLKSAPLEVFNFRQRIMVLLFRISPRLFDFISLIIGKRKEPVFMTDLASIGTKRNNESQLL